MSSSTERRITIRTRACLTYDTHYGIIDECMTGAQKQSQPPLTCSRLRETPVSKGCKVTASR